MAVVITRDVWLEQYEQLPVGIQEYLLSLASSAHEEAAQQALAYDNDAWDRVMDVVWELIFYKLSYADFHEELKPLVGNRTIEEVERALLFHIVLPMADLLNWEVEDRLVELGVPLKDIQTVPRIALRPVSYGTAVRRIASIAKISLLSDEFVRRLRDVLVSYITGIRSVDQAKEVIQRSQNDGGVGFSREQAELFMNTAMEFMNTTRVMSEQEYAKWVTHEQEVAEQKQSEALAAAKAKSAMQDADALTAAGMTTSAASTTARTSMDEAVQSVMKEIADIPLDDYLQKRMVSTISTRLTDVRNDIQTKSILQREAKIGGLELDAATADRVAVVIERAYNAYRSKIVDEEKKKIEQTLLTQKQKVEERRQRESEEHARWYQEKMKTSAEEGNAQQQFAKAMQSMMTSSTTPTPVPQVDAVVAPVRLMGLGEELGNMTWEEFRRLAKAPDQAAEKIKQKLETLQAESFERWTEGVQAWRNSPMQRDYLSLVSESFAAGKPVAELVETKHATDPRSPSPDEIAALIQLNALVHF